MCRILTSVFIIGLLSAGCTTTQKTTTSKSMEMYGAGIIQHPIVAELNVSQRKVSGSESSIRGGSMANVRNYAVADALNGIRADILVEPVFETTIEGKQVNCNSYRLSGNLCEFQINYSR